MRGSLLVVACAGCAAVPATAPDVARAVPPLDDAAALQRAHAFFDSVDQRDLNGFAAMVTGGFLLFEEGRTLPAETLSRRWAESRRRGKPPRTRTCDEEAIHRSDGALVYVGNCVEHDPATRDAVAKEWKGYNVVVLVPERGAWKVALWHWERSGIEAERARWNEEYRRGIGFTKERNELLARSVRGVEPGRALDLAMGQGRNALYLASLGWKVTGVDIADEGIRQARAAASERGLSLDAVLADIDQYDFGNARWDLVSMVYAGASMQWIQRIKPSLKPGGLFVFEFFYKDPRDPKAERGIDVRELETAFAGWDVVEKAVVEDVADWGKSKVMLVRFVARKR